MKTADSIEAQEERKQARDSEGILPANTQPGTQKRRRGDASYTARIASWKWRPGQSGNPSGRPHRDLAAEIARAVFENNAEALYKAYTKAALKRNAYAFKELADRAFGKLKERVEIEPYRDMTAEDLQKRMRELETQLGVPHAEPEVPPLTDESTNRKPN